jgi:hypothetical protein
MRSEFTILSLMISKYDIINVLVSLCIERYYIFANNSKTFIGGDDD